MTGFVYGSMLLVAVLALAQLLIWAGRAYMARLDNNRTRDFRRVVLLAEADALRAVARNRQADQVNLRG